MQRKHLIAFTLATVFMLLGFNMINNYFHQKNRAALLDADVTVVRNKGSDSISAQSLGEHPKAIIDNATAQIERAQSVEQQRLELMQESAE